MCPSLTRALLSLTVICSLLAGVTTSTAHAAALPNATPTAITVDRAGTIWFTETRGVERLTPPHTLKLFPVSHPVIADLSHIVALSDGSIWFLADSSHLGRIGPTGTLTLIHTPTRIGHLFLLAQGLHDTLWLLAFPTTSPPASQPRRLLLTHFLPSNTFIAAGSIPGATIVPQVEPNITDLAASPDGTLWFTEMDDALQAPEHLVGAYIGHLDPRTMQLNQVPLPVEMQPFCPRNSIPCMPTSVAVRQNGTAWFPLVSTGIGYVDASSTLHLLPFRGIYGLSSATAVAPDGDLAFATAGGSDAQHLNSAICRVDAKNTIHCTPVSTRLDRYFGLVFGPNGTLWFTAPCTNSIGSLTRQGKVTFIHIPGTTADAGTKCPAVPYG